MRLVRMAVALKTSAVKVVSCEYVDDGSGGVSGGNV